MSKNNEYQALAKLERWTADHSLWSPILYGAVLAVVSLAVAGGQTNKSEFIIITLCSLCVGTFFVNRVLISENKALIKQTVDQLDTSANSLAETERRVTEETLKLSTSVSRLERARETLSSRISPFKNSSEYFSKATNELESLDPIAADDNVRSVSSYYKPAGNGMREDRKEWLKTLTQFVVNTGRAQKLLIVVPKEYCNTAELANEHREMILSDIRIRLDAINELHGDNTDKRLLHVKMTTDKVRDMIIFKDRFFNYVSSEGTDPNRVHREGYFTKSMESAAFERRHFDKTLWDDLNCVPAIDLGITADDFDDLKKHLQFEHHQDRNAMRAGGTQSIIR